MGDLFIFKSKKAQIQVNQLYQFVLLIILVGMIIGVGVMTLDTFGSINFYKRTGYNDSSVTTPILNNTLVKLDFGNLTLLRIVNDTGGDIIASECYTINATPGEFVYNNESENCNYMQNLHIIYDYKEFNTKTTVALSSASKEVSNISSEWIGLIITVTILAIVLGLVIASFVPALGRR